MKTRRTFTVTVIALLLCFSMVLSASALTVTNSARAGIYGTLTGTVTTHTRAALLPATTAVTQNPDNAYLTVIADVSNGVEILNSFSFSSEKGVTSFSTSIPVYNYMGPGDTFRVYTTHGV